MPVLFVRGTKDPFSTEKPWEEVLQRMASSDVQVESVEKGDHSLGSKTAAGKARCGKLVFRP